MALTIRRDTKQRLLEILETVPALVKNTVAPAIPKGRQDYEGYVMSVLPIRTIQRPGSNSTATSTLTWRITCTSPQVGMGLNVKQEDTMLAYADAIQDVMNGRQQLQNARGEGLRFVDTATLTGDGGLQLLAYPDGQTESQHLAYQFELTVTYTVQAC